MVQSASNLGVGIHVRGLPVAQQTLLLLELLNLLLVGGLGNQLVNVAEVALSRDVEACILLADAIAPAQLVVRADQRGSRPVALGHSSLVLELLVDPSLSGRRRGNGRDAMVAKLLEHDGLVVGVAEGSLSLDGRGPEQRNGRWLVLGLRQTIEALKRGSGARAHHAPVVLIP